MPPDHRQQRSARYCPDVGFPSRGGARVIPLSHRLQLPVSCEADTMTPDSTPIRAHRRHRARGFMGKITILATIALAFLLAGAATCARAGGSRDDQALP